MGAGGWRRGCVATERLEGEQLVLGGRHAWSRSCALQMGPCCACRNRSPWLPDLPPTLLWLGPNPTLQVGCGTTELGDRPWLPGAPSGYFSARIRWVSIQACSSACYAVSPVATWTAAAAEAPPWHNHHMAPTHG